MIVSKSSLTTFWICKLSSEGGSGKDTKSGNGREDNVLVGEGWINDSLSEDSESHVSNLVDVLQVELNSADLLAIHHSNFFSFLVRLLSSTSLFWSASTVSSYPKSLLNANACAVPGQLRRMSDTDSAFGISLQIELSNTGVDLSIVIDKVAKLDSFSTPTILNLGIN